MSKAANHVFFGVLALLALLVISLWTLLHRTQLGNAVSVRWGSANLTLSEAAYYEDRVNGIIDAWIEMGQHADHDEDGRFKEPHHVYLVIDAAHRAVWIEDGGQVLEAYVTELPGQMTWTVHCDSGSVLTSYAQVTRLRHRGAHADRHCPELIWLVGRHGAGWHISFHFNSHFLGETNAYDGPFHPHYNAPPRKKGVNYYDSIVISEAEYAESRLVWTHDNEARTRERGSQRTAIDENRVTWLKVEKRLYQAIEGHLNRAGGFDPGWLTVKPGPDYSAAHAEIGMVTRSFLRRLRGGSQTAYAYLKIDSLGDAIWYVRTAPDPRKSYFVSSTPEPPKLEFLVSAGNPVKPSDRAGWIEKGRKMPDSPPSRHSRWRAELPNEAVVELIGTCESLAANKQWWSPDGSPIDYVPSFNDALHGHGTTDQKVFEFMWRVQRPEGTILSVQSSSPDGSPLGDRQPCDRHGAELLDVYCHSHVFEKSQERGTLTLGVDVDGRGIQHVRFTNISLVPGRDFGLEIEVLR